MNHEQEITEQTLRQIYFEGVKASYFSGIKVSQALLKSTKSSCSTNISESTNQKTFRLKQPNIKRANSNPMSYSKSGKCYINKPSIFSCFGKPKCHDIQLDNSKLSLQYQGKIIKFVDFHAVSADVVNKEDYFVINFASSQQILYIQPVSFSLENKEIVSEWVKIVEVVINETQGKRKNFTFLCKQMSPFFLQMEHALAEEFERLANSGDILLIQSQYSHAAINKTFIDSEYDHVGVVLINQKNEILILQSTIDKGVGLTEWKDLIESQWYKLTSRICWRKLTMKLGLPQIRKIENFIVRKMGKNHKEVVGKLFDCSSKSKGNQVPEQSTSTFACSQLVAQLYKELGILKNEKPSSSYSPMDFSDRGVLEFTRPSFRLQNQILLSFDR